MKKLMSALCLACVAAAISSGCAAADSGGPAPETMPVSVEAQAEESKFNSRMEQLSGELKQAEEEKGNLQNSIAALEKENEALRLALEQAEMGNTSNEIETERKFIVDVESLPEDMASRAEIYQFVQTYLSYSPEMRVRNVNDRTYYFTLKLPKDDIGLSREEINFRIPQEDYAELLKKQVGETIHKTRYQFYEGENQVFVDVYSGVLEGLAVAEVEFESVELAEAFTPPDWFGEDVTSDKRYKNASLSKNGAPEDE